jgi:hypothetical protein
MKWVYLGLVLWILFVGFPFPSVAKVVMNFVDRGERVTTATQGSDGIITESPDDLASVANVDTETYSLARAIASEEETKVVDDPNYLIGVAWVIVNEAKARGISITDLLTSGSVGPGQYGKQSVGPRYASTWEDPYTRDIDIATAIQTGTIADITQGSRHFFAPATQDKLHAKNPSKYKSSTDLIAFWGGTAIDVPNVNPAKLMFIKIG